MCSNIITLNIKCKLYFIYFILLATFMIEFDYTCPKQFLIELCTMFHDLKKNYVRLGIEKTRQ